MRSLFVAFVAAAFVGAACATTLAPEPEDRDAYITDALRAVSDSGMFHAPTVAPTSGASLFRCQRRLVVQCVGLLVSWPCSLPWLAAVQGCAVLGVCSAVSV